MTRERNFLPRRGTIALLCAALALPLLVFAPKADAAQVSFSVQIGTPPVCPYGYYEFPPYSCAPPGFYGPGYFYNGIFLGVGPWANWGYAHGWGTHRFIHPGGGRYYHGYWAHRPHPRASHHWDHGRAYGYYGHPGRGHSVHRETHSRGRYEHHDNGRGHSNHHDRGHGRH